MLPTNCRIAQRTVRNNYPVFLQFGAMAKTKHHEQKQLLAFHTGLMAYDYCRFPRPPYCGNGWQVDLASPDTRLPVGSATIGNQTYPAKEIIIRAKNEVDAQRAADLIHASRLLLDGSNLLSHIYPASMRQFMQ
jgi:hypothetical protein